MPEMPLMTSEAKNKAKNKTSGKRLKLLTSKQLLQRLPIALAQVEVGNNSGNLLNENRQIVYYFYQSKEITRTVYDNIIKSLSQYNYKTGYFIYELKK